MKDAILLMMGDGRPTVHMSLLAASVRDAAAGTIRPVTYYPLDARPAVPSRGLPRRRRRDGAPAAKLCGLPGCDALTTHNGGYCCAAHCLEHRERWRGR